MDDTHSILLHFENEVWRKFETLTLDTLEKSFKLLELPPAEISVAFVGLEKIQELNESYRGLDSPTDVLSFVQDGESEGRSLLGDLAISPEYAEKSVSQNPKATSLEDEIRLLLVHGLLHLRGMDHSNTEEEKVMFGLQNEILHKIQL